ncbi:MAG: GIY-YIG nuclease family protein [Sulfurimonas sp.]|uniref:GIY-YIG nuclease family protein n=1 Tax=Sulfurimonas sp. TaxID=2022749 RepID=UPI0026272BAA|nr:GIY-YIG nuclease family protein [Sulfurimonas sp.]MDD3476201.1 GIY-YIG nuclease family protein [Sulfurimonas sp.]HUH42822.1 GIY-YIG nuclease family protein [Sulfurimonas sp.]
MNNTKTFWFVYILKCSDDTLYTGITIDLNRRLDEHNNSPKGAKYTRIRRPLELLYFEEYQDKSSASKRELEIKKLSRGKKLELIK